MGIVLQTNFPYIGHDSYSFKLLDWFIVGLRRYTNVFDESKINRIRIFVMF